MIPPQFPQYRTALAGSHNAYSRVEVWRAGIKVLELNNYEPFKPDRMADTPVFLSGSVRATLASRVARTLTLTVPDRLYPYRDTDLLNPYTTQLRAFRGIRYGSGGGDEFPVFVGAITSVSAPANGSCQVQAADRAADVVLAGFSAPSRANVGALITEEVQQIILEALPDAEFGDFSDSTEKVPELSYDYDRGAALDALAKTASMVWYPLADGRFVLRFVPWTVALTNQSLPMFDGLGGTLLSAVPNRSRDGVYSRVTVTSERADGSTPVAATVDDLDPTSPTYVLGPFGIKAVQVRVTTSVSQQQALSTAQTLLRRAKARTESWQLTCVTDASIELGDPLAVSWKGHTTTQIVAGFTLPLDPQGTMQIDGRDLVLGVDDL